MTRGFSVPNITLAQALKGIKDWNVLPFAAASACCVYLLFMRWYYYFDILGGFTFIVGLFVCGITFTFALDEAGRRSPAENTALRLKLRTARQMILLALMTILFYVSSSKEGYRFNYVSGQSTLMRGFLPVSPFGMQPVFFVYKSQSQRIDVDILTKDAVPLRCNIHAGGIILDERDPLKLEAMIFNLDPAIEPQGQIGSAVMSSLASAATRVISAKTSVEIAQEKQFLIPYNIGTPLGDTFNKYMLQWRSGEVNFSCKVRFG